MASNMEVSAAAEAFGLDVTTPLQEGFESGLLKYRSKRLIFPAKSKLLPLHGEEHPDTLYLLKEVGPGSSEVDVNNACDAITTFGQFSSPLGREKVYAPPLGGNRCYAIRFQAFLPTLADSSVFVFRYNFETPTEQNESTGRLWVCTRYTPNASDLRGVADDQLVRNSIAAAMGCLHEGTASDCASPVSGAEASKVFLTSVTNNLEPEDGRMDSGEMQAEAQALEAELFGVSDGAATAAVGSGSEPVVEGTDPSPSPSSSSSSSSPSVAAAVGSTVSSQRGDLLSDHRFPLPTFPDHGPKYLEKDEHQRFVWTGSAFARCRFVLQKLFSNPADSSSSFAACVPDQTERQHLTDYFMMLLVHYAPRLNNLPHYVTSGDNQRKNILLSATTATADDSLTASSSTALVNQVTVVNCEKTVRMSRVWDLAWLILLDDDATGIPSSTPTSGVATSATPPVEEQTAAASAAVTASPDNEETAEEHMLDENALTLQRIKTSLTIYCRSCLTHPLTDEEIALFPIATQIKSAMIASILPEYRSQQLCALRWAMDHEHPLRMIAMEVQQETQTWRSLLRRMALDA